MRSIIGPGGKIKGYFMESDNQIKLLAPGGRLLGLYDKKKDQTFELGGSFYGYGNQLMDLLEE